MLHDLGACSQPLQMWLHTQALTHEAELVRMKELLLAIRSLGFTSPGPSHPLVVSTSPVSSGASSQ